jgi:molybdopterin-guanine dinucleotide biosynthesis protein A
MGTDKATMLVEGIPNAARIARVLRGVVHPAIEVGPGVSGLASVAENPPGSGPLMAVAAGGHALRVSGHRGPVVVMACDLPAVSERSVAMLAHWPGDTSIVPVVDGIPQPLFARWSGEALMAATELAGSGARSMRVLLELPGLLFADEASWPPGVEARCFFDVDSPEDLERLELS